MAAKLLFALTASFLLSGCCEIFGICTSVNVHTAIQPPYQLASQDGVAAPAHDLESSPVQTPTHAGSNTTLAELNVSNIAFSGL